MANIYNNSSVTIDTSNNTLTYGPYSISVGNASSVIQPDLGTLTLISDTTDATGYVTGNNITFQSNTITAGNGTDTVYGTMYELNLVANDFVFMTFRNAVIADTMITFDGNNITVGNGANDTVYGTMFEMNLSPAWGGIIGGVFGNYAPNIFTFDATTIVAGNGANDALYGTMYELSLNADPHGFIGGFVGGSDDFNFAGNYLQAGNGSHDSLYGNSDIINLTSGTFIGGFVGISNVDLEFGSNTLLAGNGNGDALYGTAGSLNLSTLHGGTYGDYGNIGNIINMAGNTITAGQGNSDTLYGSLGTFALLALDASNDGGGTIGTYGAAFNTFSFGPNVISVGDGNNDTVVGTIGNFSLTTTMIPENGGPDVNSFNLIGGQFGGGNTYSLAANSLSAGIGNGDVLYGSVENLTLSAANAHLENLFNADYYHKSYSYIGGALGGGENDFTFGSVGHNHSVIGNTLTVLNGNNDVLYGTLGDMALSATNGGTTSFISNDPNFPGDNLLVGVFVGGFDGGHNTMTFGDNNLTAGNGNNDVLYGSMHDLVLSATLGGNVGNADLADTSGDSYNLIQFGNNTLTVGSGDNDIIYGNMHDIIVTVDNTSHVDGNIVHFGSSTLNAGSGNDTLVGLMDRIIVNGETISQFLSQNTIASAGAYTTFNLGTGVDTLVFDASINMGTNIVNNFNVSKDILEFTNATGPATNTNIVGSLDSAANVHITFDGSHGTLVTFLANGGSIDFTNVNYTGQTHLSDLVNHQAAHLIIV